MTEISTVQAVHPKKSGGASVKFKPPNIELPPQTNGDTPQEDSNSKSPMTPAPPGSAREDGDKMHKEKKMGHRRVDKDTGEVTYKRVPTSQLMGAIQLGIGNAIGSLAGTPKRDLLVQDFDVVDKLAFPSEGTNTTPSHSFGDFRFKCYAPIAFRYFRDLFNIKPEDFLSSVCSDPMRELSNPGASGSVFYVSQDDQFIIKTVQHKEAEFLQKLLPGYYMNLQQNPRTLLPKFFGLYCYQSLNKNVRLLAMNNLLPFSVKMHQKYDLKGSTYKRRASKHERAKANPTLKDLDFMEDHPDGIYLEAETYDALFKTISRDCLVLESFKIMDFSLLLGIHNIDQAQKEKVAEFEAGMADAAASTSKDCQNNQKPDPNDRKVKRQKSIFSAWESIQVDAAPVDLGDEYPTGGLPARNNRGERLLLFIGIIDILQNYRLFKKIEHTWKSVLHDGDTISVHRPGFYAERFQKFFREIVFKKIVSSLKPSPSKKRTAKDRRGTTGSSEERHRSSSHGADMQTGSSTARPDLVPPDTDMGDKTPLGARLSGGRRLYESGKNQLQRQENTTPDVASVSDVIPVFVPQPKEKRVERLFGPDDSEPQTYPTRGVFTGSKHVIKVGRSISVDDEQTHIEMVNRQHKYS